MAAVFAITAAGPGALQRRPAPVGHRWAIAQLAAGAGGALAMVKLTERPTDVQGSGGFTQPAETPEPANA